MDKNTWIGFLLIAAIIVGFTMLNRPSKEQLAERQRVQDSISHSRLMQMEAQRLADSISATMEMPVEQTQEEVQPDEQWVTLQNEHLRLTLSTYGGVIQRAELLEYHASGDSVNPLCLFGVVRLHAHHHQQPYSEHRKALFHAGGMRRAEQSDHASAG